MCIYETIEQNNLIKLFTNTLSHTYNYLQIHSHTRTTIHMQSHNH